MLKQIELTTSEARTPAEKMNAVKQSLAKIEALVNGYNELVPSINAMVEEVKNFELPQIEDNTERLDRIEQSITQMVESIGSASSSIEGLKTSISQLDKKQKSAVKTVHKKEKYDDSGLMKIINEQSRMMNEIEKKVNSIVIPEIPEHKDYDDELLWSTISDLCRALNGVDAKVSSIKMPSMPKPKKYDDSKLISMISEQSDKIRKLESVKIPEIIKREVKVVEKEVVAIPNADSEASREALKKVNEMESKVIMAIKVASEAKSYAEFVNRKNNERYALINQSKEK
jgi:uncharacterized protein involved in tolerance to divalent cations